MKRIYLGEFEEIVLLLVAALNGEGYGVNIMRQVEEQTERTVRLNQVHASLLRLEEKGMITSRMSAPSAERGGRRKRLFTITAYGKQVLHEIKDMRSHLWNLIPYSI